MQVEFLHCDIMIMCNVFDSLTIFLHDLTKVQLCLLIELHIIFILLALVNNVTSFDC